MLNSGEQRIAEIMNLFEDMKLFTEEEIGVIEGYISGEIAEEEGREELGKFAFRDLSKVSREIDNKMSSRFMDLFNKGKKEIMDRLANVIFMVGASTGFEMFPTYLFNYRPEGVFSDCVMEISIYANKIGFNSYSIGSSSLDRIVKLAGNDPENLKLAAGFQRNKEKNGKLLILTAYFLLKYPKKKEIVFLEEDAPLLAECEEICLQSVHDLSGNRLSGLALAKMVDTMRKDETGKKVVKLAKECNLFGVGGQALLMKILTMAAFANHVLSYRLKNVLLLCLALNMESTLGMMDSADARGEMPKECKDYNPDSFDCRNCKEELDEKCKALYTNFNLDDKVFLKWTVARKKTTLAKLLCKEAEKSFLTYMDGADFDSYNWMNAILKEVDPACYEKRKSKELSRQQDKVIDAFVNLVDKSLAGTVRGYLKGEEGIEAMVAIEDRLPLSGYHWGGQHWNNLKSYEKGYGYDKLSARCEVLMMMCRGFNYYYYLVDDNNKMSGAAIKRLFDMVDSEGLSVKQQMNSLCDLVASCYNDKWKEKIRNIGAEAFAKYLEKKRAEVLAAFSGADSNGRSFALMVLSKETEKNRKEILSYSQDSSKAVREALLAILYEQKGWEEDVIGLLSSKKVADRETAVRVLAKWDNEKYLPLLKEMLEKEKNGKLRTLLESLLNADSTEAKKTLTAEDMVKELHKGGKKRSLVWAYETPFSAVHKKTGEEAAEEYLQAIFLCYSTMGELGVNKSAALLAEGLEEKELAVYVNELFDKWLDAGAEAKKRWVLYAASIHGGERIITKLNQKIQEWPQAARGAIASDAVRALALNPLPQALLIVDGIARKFKFKQVKAAAGAALDFAASELGITTEELADRIVPNLGFDENMERLFDYGERKFTVTITPALEIEVFDEAKKKLKSLPAPGKKDDAEKAVAAYEEFKLMKKQMKTTVSSQKARLEIALSTAREWSMQAWKDLFVKNPIMHQFAIGLIWGVYEDGKLTASFRYMEDGSFNTEDEDEFELPGGGSELPRGGSELPGGEEGGKRIRIGLVHPIDLSEDSQKAWKEQLADYEITQPIEQIDRAVYYRTEEEAKEKNMERFGGCIVNDLSLGGKLAAMGWYRGEILDGGGFDTYYREDKELNLGVELHFSGSYVGGGNEDVTIYEARFYSINGTMPEGYELPQEKEKKGKDRYAYYRSKDATTYFLKDVPKRYFSEVVLQIFKALAASKEKNENWRASR